MSAFASMLAIASLQGGTGNAFAQSLEFSASVPAVLPGGESHWPRKIVTFTDRALLPVASICNADCGTLAIRQKGEVRRHELVHVKGQGAAAIVPVGGERPVLTACVGETCITYHVVVVR